MTSSPRWMTLTAMRPVEGFANGRELSLLSGRGVLVDLGLQRGLERFLGIVRAEEVGVADEEAFLVVVLSMNQQAMPSGPEDAIWPVSGRRCRYP